MDAILLGLIGAMGVGAAIIAVLLSRKGRRSGFSSGAGAHGAHDRFSSADATPSPVDPPVFLAYNDVSGGQVAGAATSLAEQEQHGAHHGHVSHDAYAAHESHAHPSPLDSLVEAAGVSLPDSGSASFSDSSSSFSSSFDSGSSFSSGDSGSPASFGSD